MGNVNTKLTESVIRQIMEGADPRAAIDSALDEKAGYHKEKRIRGGKATVVNVKNTKRKVHHTLTADQKKAIKKAHSAAANKKRAKSLKKGAKLGLYKESVSIMSEDEAVEATGLILPCPACGNANLEIFTDAEGEDTDGIVLVCPDCGETFVICATSEIEDEEEDDAEDEKDDDKDDAEDKEVKGEEDVDAAEKEVPQDEAKVSDENADPVKEATDAEHTDDCEDCKDANCDDGQPEEESGLFFAQE